MIRRKGNPVSSGVAIGRILIYKTFTCQVEEGYFEDGQQEQYLARYRQAMEKTNAELDTLIDYLAGSSRAQVFEAHKEILEDEDLQEAIQEAIESDCMLPEYAVVTAYDTFVRLLRKTNDPMIAARADDLIDVRNRLVRVLQGEPERNLAALPHPVIIVAHDLLPSDTATLDRANVLGILTEVGGTTSHSAIIARGYGLPAILGVADVISQLQDGMTCVLDALDGDVYADPTPETLEIMEHKQEKFRKVYQDMQKYYLQPGATADGLRVDIGLNAGSVAYEEAYDAVDFVGLLRSEFLYMQSDHLPTEEEQYKAYCQVIAHASGKPVTLRTLDIGGDKSLPYFQLPKEDNPFLGNRALRLCLANPQILNTQLRAALRASVKGPLWIMFPMVGSMDDIYAAKAAVERAKAELTAQEIPYDPAVKIGVMIEIPALAEISDLVAAEVDFASVGSNDLTQYAHAVDRMNEQITQYYQSNSPAMYRMLGRIFQAFRAAGKPVSVCGELAGTRIGALVMAGLGLRKMSMSGSAIAGVKMILSKFTLAETEALAQTVRQLPTEKQVLEYVQSAIDEKIQNG